MKTQDTIPPSIPSDALEGVYAAVQEAASHVQTATGLVSMAIHKGNRDLMPAFEHARIASAAATEAAQTLHKLGLRPSPTSDSTSGPAARSIDPFDLSALATLDTPDTRELLELLTRAQAVAERVDASRGRTLPAHLPLEPGESRGTDLAETISEMTLRLRGEVHGQMIGRE